MARLRKVGSIYAQIGRTYRAWAPSLLLLAVIVFVPLSLLDTIMIHAEIGSLDFDSNFELLAVVGATAVITVVALLGEVFYSGAVAVSLTHPHHGQAPPLREIAGRLRYGRLIAIDLIYGVVVAIGLLLLVAPGVAAFVWLALAGPIVEIEGRGVRAAFARSFQLIRGHFWTALLVLAPVEVVGDGVARLAATLVHDLLGEALLATWIAESVAQIVFIPIFAVAAVLLTLELIAEKDDDGPRLNPSPTKIAA